MNLYSTKQVADLLGYNDDSYIRKLVLNGKLEAQKIGKQWMVSEEAIDTYKIQNTIKTKYKILLAFNQELRSLAEEILTKRIPENGPKSGFASFAIVRAYKTQGAIIELCKQGYGEDATVLLRSLFELHVTLLYILADPTEERAYRYFTYDWILRKKMYTYILGKKDLMAEIKKRESNPKPGDTTISEVLHQADMAQKKFGYKKGRWSDKSTEEMAKEVGKYRAYKTIYALQCQFSHNLPRIINDYATIDSFGLAYNIGLSENWIEENLVTLFDFFYNILVAFNKELGFSLEKKLKDIEDRYIETVSEMNNQS